MQISFSFRSMVWQARSVVVGYAKKQNPQCGNTCEQILLNEPRKHWPQYMDSGLAHVQSNIFLE